MHIHELSFQQHNYIYLIIRLMNIQEGRDTEVEDTSNTTLCGAAIGIDVHCKLITIICKSTNIEFKFSGSYLGRFPITMSHNYEPTDYYSMTDKEIAYNVS